MVFNFSHETTGDAGAPRRLRRVNVLADPYLFNPPNEAQDWLTRRGTQFLKRKFCSLDAGLIWVTLAGFVDIDGVAIALHDARHAVLHGWRASFTKPYNEILRRTNSSGHEVVLGFRPQVGVDAPALMARENEYRTTLRMLPTGEVGIPGELGHGIAQVEFLNESIAAIPVWVDGVEVSPASIDALPDDIREEYISSLVQNIADDVKTNHFYPGFIDTFNDMDRLVQSYDKAESVAFGFCPVVNSQAVATLLNRIFSSSDQVMTAFSGQVLNWNVDARDARGVGTRGAFEFGAIELGRPIGVHGAGKMLDGINFSFLHKVKFPRMMADLFGIRPRDYRNAFYLCDGESDLAAIREMRCHLIQVFNVDSEVACREGKRAFAATHEIYTDGSPESLRPAPAFARYRQTPKTSVDAYLERAGELRRAIMDVSRYERSGDVVRDLISQHVGNRDGTVLTDLGQLVVAREVLLAFTVSRLVTEELIALGELDGEFEMRESFHPGPLSTVENFNSLVDAQLELLASGVSMPPPLERST